MSEDEGYLSSDAVYPSPDIAMQSQQLQVQHSPYEWWYDHGSRCVWHGGTPAYFLEDYWCAAAYFGDVSDNTDSGHEFAYDLYEGEWYPWTSDCQSEAPPPFAVPGADVPLPSSSEDSDDQAAVPFVQLQRRAPSPVSAEREDPPDYDSALLLRLTGFASFDQWNATRTIEPGEMHDFFADYGDESCYSSA